MSKQREPVKLQGHFPWAEVVLHGFFQVESLLSLIEFLISVVWNLGQDLVFGEHERTRAGTPPPAVGGPVLHGEGEAITGVQARLRATPSSWWWSEVPEPPFFWILKCSKECLAPFAVPATHTHPHHLQGAPQTNSHGIGPTLKSHPKNKERVSKILLSIWYLRVPGVGGLARWRQV